MFQFLVCFSLLLVSCQVGLTNGQGRLIEPPSRNSAWRFGFHTPVNNADDRLNCGGLKAQWYGSNGQCGVCGDPYQGVRDHEAGGKYATGTIVRSYGVGETIDIVVDITHGQKGWMEFRLCPNNNPKVPVTQDCLDKYVLRNADGSGTKTLLNHGSGKYVMKYILPDGLSCSQCVLQWLYDTGSVGDTIPREQYVNCADIAVGGGGTGTGNTAAPSTGTGNGGNGGSSVMICKAIGAFFGNAAADAYCTSNCSRGVCPPSVCKCVTF
ncbi:uncharacterized protein LOC106159259 [Lingula anatina]|uniref:Uncharacterized protein LOC106159259 n=1 Tax=Lingula anatina TaxID=7574 RepID=A0A1S3I0R0_LINAN|nr:uncharacterized protein LOC106159259 [Lingula anatina]|eukprot:XP_013390934.1 uncharacterized protein LOC106159259 [Lingula anatina]